MLEQLLQNHLSTNVAAVSGRVYAYLLPQEPTHPSLVYFQVSGYGDYDFDGDTGLVSSRYQISVYANSYKEAKTVTSSVKEAMKLPIDASVKAPMLTNCSDAYEDATDTFRVDIDFTLWHQS